MKKWQVINGNNIDILKEYPDNHFDSIVTDPPYGIEFLGKDWDSNTGAMETWQECFRVLKPGGHMLAFSAARTYHHLATNVESAGFEIRDQLMWIYASGFPKAQDLGKAIQKRQGVEKTRELTYYEKGASRAFACRNKSNGDQKALGNGVDTIPTSPEALEWSGWKTALKPAHEPIVMARKPFSGSCVDNVLQWGTGAMNIDASRVEYADGADKDSIVERVKKYPESFNGLETATFADQQNNGYSSKQNASDYEQGRYPSNVLGEIPEYQKYFYCPKVSRRERHVGFDTKNIPAPFGDVKGAYVDGKRMAKVADDSQYAASGNNHPTVKPVELMKYLIKLVTPPGGRVLDPFNGSGSTGMAAVELGYDYVGCELDPDYVEIANNRIAAWAEMHDTPARRLFD